MSLVHNQNKDTHTEGNKVVELCLRDSVVDLLGGLGLVQAACVWVPTLSSLLSVLGERVRCAQLGPPEDKDHCYIQFGGSL